MTTSQTEQLLESVRQMPIFRQLVPMEAGIGWPIPLRKDGKVYVTLPFFGFSRAPGAKQTQLSPPFAVLTLAWRDTVPVEYFHLRFRCPAPELPWEGVVGSFPHPAVANLTVGQYQARRSELLALYDTMFQRLGAGEPLDDAWAARFQVLLGQFVEPSLLPYYRAIAPKFFARFLPE